MSKRIGIDVPASSDFVRLYPTSGQQVIDVLPGTLQVRHRVRDSHERGQFTLPHNHPRSRSPPRTTIETPHPTESTQKRPYTAKYPTQYTSNNS